MGGHTPGPWTWSDDMTMDAEDGDAYVVRTLDGEDGSVLYHHALWDVEDADRALIAAAPELLEALRAANVYQCGETCGANEHSEECRASIAAIAKAEGR